MERAWQPSIKTTAGSDILHKPGDASGVMEATSRDIEKGREEEGERFGGAGGGTVAVNIMLFVSRLLC